MSAIDLLRSPALAGELRRQDRRVILLWPAGGASQLETWDPKPGTKTGGPFRAIPTDVPGIHVSELLPKLARRLVEAGVPFVKVARAWWDSHGQNFETHRELCADLDRCMSTLLDDLEQRGLLDTTLVITLGEFGRTPGINASLGRDHFASAWSCSLSGAGVRGGVAYGKTDTEGRTVVDGEASAGDLFATILAALGIDHEHEYMLGARPIPLADFGSRPIRDVLA